MSYTYKVVEDFPLVAYPMSPGEVGGYTDISGNATASVIYGTPSATPPLVSGGGAAYVVNDTNGFRFSVPVFVGTDVNRTFTLEAWFKHKDSTGVIQILGHDHATDGITWDGDAIRFTTRHGAAGDSVATYYPSDIEGAFYVVASHSSTKNELYVNGVLRATAELTDDQVAAGYTTTTNPGLLYAGHIISGAGGVIVDSIAVYDRILTTTEVQEHYAWAYRVSDMRDVVPSNGGTLWTFTDNETELLLDKNFYRKEDWLSGESIDVSINDTLTPSFEVPNSVYETVNILPTAAQSFEDGTTGGWTGITSVAGTVANSSADFYVGTRSLLITKDTGYVFARYASVNTINYGTSYVFSGWVKPSSSILRIVFRESGTGANTFNPLVITGLVPNEWQRISRVYTPTNDTITAISFEFGWEAADVASGATVYIDAVQIEIGTIATDYTSNTTELTLSSISSIAGTWRFGIILDALDTVIDGSKIEWDGDGTFTIETSINNEASWSSAVNGREVVGISNGFATALKDITIRVSFQAGLPTTTNSVLRSLRLKLYKRRSPSAVNAERLATITGAAALSPQVYQPIQMHDGAGIDLYGGYAILAKDLDASPSVSRTIEGWFKHNTTPLSTTVFMDARESGADPAVHVTTGVTGQLTATGGVLYINGLPYTNGTTLNINQWYHYAFVLTADNSKNITLNARYNGTDAANVSWSMVAIYPTALSSASILQAYNNYLGISGISVVDTSVVNVFETSSVPLGLPAKIYAYNWSISPAG